MSGPICPECGSFQIESYDDKEGKSKDRCEVCNWEGEPLPRKILSMQMYQDREKVQEEKRQAREKGELFFVRVYVDEIEIDAEEYILIEECLLEHIETDAIESPQTNPPYFYIESTKKPSDQVIEKLKKNKHVIDITVY